MATSRKKSANAEDRVAAAAAAITPDTRFLRVQPPATHSNIQTVPVSRPERLRRPWGSGKDAVAASFQLSPAAHAALDHAANKSRYVDELLTQNAAHWQAALTVLLDREGWTRGELLAAEAALAEITTCYVHLPAELRRAEKLFAVASLRGCGNTWEARCESTRQDSVATALRAVIWELRRGNSALELLLSQAPTTSKKSKK